MKSISSSIRRKPRTALEVMDEMIGDDHELRAMVAVAEINLNVAELIYDARMHAGLTQAELAKLIGTKQPVIARLEDADYQGHSLTMLQRIATALNQRLELRLVAQPPTAPASAAGSSPSAHPRP